jgi:hypothetical protein
VTLHIFKDAVEGMLPVAARELIERQYADVSTAHARVTALSHPEATFK